MNKVYYTASSIRQVMFGGECIKCKLNDHDTDHLTKKFIIFLLF